MRHQSQIWRCKIGEVDLSKLPEESDFPMREAIRDAYIKLTGEEPKFLFSGWNAELDEYEREVVDGKEKQ